MIEQPASRCCVCGRYNCDGCTMWFRDTVTGETYCTRCGFDELVRRMEEAGE